MKALPYFGGLPTKPDVEKLIKELGVPKEDTFISYERIGDIIGIKYDGPDRTRYRTITDAWRKYLERSHNVFIDVEPTKGYRVATPGLRVDMGSRKYTSYIRDLGRSVKLADVPSDRLRDLSDEERKRHDFLTYNATRLLQAHRDSAKKLPSGK